LDQNIHQSQVEYELSGLSRDSDGVVDVVVDLGKMWRKVEESGRKWR
jgi:predicted solute-binding protein